MSKDDKKVGLKQCPFCMSFGVTVLRSTAQGRKRDWGYVSCISCGARGPQNYPVGEAITMWNEVSRA